MKKIFLLLSLFLTFQLNAQIFPGVIESQTVPAAAPGGEIITNGSLSSATAWTVSGGVTIGSGVVTFDDVTTGHLEQTEANLVTPILINTAYTLTFDVAGTSGGGLYLLISSYDSGDGAVTYKAIAEYNDGSKVVNFTTPAVINDGGFRIYFSNAGDSGGTIDNISLTAD